MGSITWDEPEQLPAGGNITWDSDQPKQQLPPNAEIVRDLVAGGLAGASRIGATIIAPFKAALAGTGQFGAQSERKRILEGVDQGLVTLGADPESWSYGGAKLGAEIAGTAGVFPAAPAASLAGRVAQNAVAGATGTAMVDPQNTAIGAGVGAAAPIVLPYAGRTLSYLGGKVYDAATGQLAKVRASNLLRKTVGEADQPAVQAAWQSARPELTAAQASADVGNRPLAALGEMSRFRDSTGYNRDILDPQRTSDLARLEAVAGSDSAAAAERAGITGREAIETAMGPERDMLLAVANVGGEAPRMLKEADTLRQLAIKMHGKGNQQAAAQANARATVLEQRAADVQKNYDPLDVSNVSSKIREIMDDPKFGPSENVTTVLSNINRQIDEWVTKGEGTIDARALYQKRKSAVNEAVGKLLAGNPAASKKLSADLAGKVKDIIDESLDSAIGGGKQWSGFLNRYSDRLKAVDRQELVAAARKMYADKNYKGFMDLVKDESPETVRAIMTTDFEIAKALSPNQLSAVTDVGKNISRNEMLTEHAAQGQNNLPRILRNEMMDLKIPGMISRVATIGNAALAAAESRLNAKTMNILTEAMKSGKSANELIKFLPANQREPAMMWVANGGLDKYATRAIPASVSATDQ
jgi:hypothetical protein